MISEFDVQVRGKTDLCRGVQLEAGDVMAAKQTTCTSGPLRCRPCLRNGLLFLRDAAFLC